MATVLKDSELPEHLQILKNTVDLRYYELAEMTKTVKPTEYVVLLTNTYREILPFLRMLQLPVPNPENMFQVFTIRELENLFHLYYKGLVPIDDLSIVVPVEALLMKASLETAASLGYDEFNGFISSYLYTGSPMRGGGEINILEEIFGGQSGGGNDDNAAATVAAVDLVPPPDARPPPGPPPRGRKGRMITANEPAPVLAPAPAQNHSSQLTPTQQASLTLRSVLGPLSNGVSASRVSEAVVEQASQQQSHRENLRFLYLQQTNLIRIALDKLRNEIANPEEQPKLIEKFRKLGQQVVKAAKSRLTVSPPNVRATAVHFHAELTERDIEGYAERFNETFPELLAPKSNMSNVERYARAAGKAIGLPINQKKMFDERQKRALLLSGVVASYFATKASVNWLSKASSNYNYPNVKFAAQRLPPKRENERYRLKAGAKAQWKRSTVVTGELSKNDRLLQAQAEAFAKGLSEAEITPLMAPGNRPEPRIVQVKKPGFFWNTVKNELINAPPEEVATWKSQKAAFEAQEIEAGRATGLLGERVDADVVLRLGEQPELLNPPTDFEPFAHCGKGYGFDPVQFQCVPKLPPSPYLTWDDNRQVFIGKLSDQCFQSETYMNGRAAIVPIAFAMGQRTGGMKLGIVASLAAYLTLQHATVSTCGGAAISILGAGVASATATLAVGATAAIAPLIGTVATAVVVKSMWDESVSRDRIKKSRELFNKNIMGGLMGSWDELVTLALGKSLLSFINNYLEIYSDPIALARDYARNGKVNSRILTTFDKKMDGLYKEIEKLHLLRQTNNQAKISEVEESVAALRKTIVDAEDEFIQEGVIKPIIDNWRISFITAITKSKQYKDDDPVIVLATILADNLAKDRTMYQTLKIIHTLVGSDENSSVEAEDRTQFRRAIESLELPMPQLNIAAASVQFAPPAGGGMLIMNGNGAPSIVVSPPSSRSPSGPSSPRRDYKMFGKGRTRKTKHGRSVGRRSTKSSRSPRM